MKDACSQVIHSLLKETFRQKKKKKKTCYSVAAPAAEVLQVTTGVIIKVTVPLVDGWKKGQEGSFCILRLFSYVSRKL